MATDDGGWIQGTRQYISEVQAEYKKITWPPQKDAMVGAVGVVVFVAIVTTVLGFVDFGLSHLMSLLVK